MVDLGNAKRLLHKVFNIGAIFVGIPFQKLIVLHFQQNINPHLNVD
jgi:hypothetical protein